MIRIELYFTNVTIITFQNMLLDYFAWKISPTYPVMIGHDLNVHQSQVNGNVSVELNYFRVLEASEDENQPSNVLANIIIHPYPTQLVIFFEPIEETKQDYYKVENIVRQIISRARLLSLDITTVIPQNLLEPIHKSDLHPWEQIEDHSWDRYALKCWWEGYSSKKIAIKIVNEYKLIHLDHTTVTNRISQLRQIYCDSIVPTDIQRRSLKFSNKS
jgi:hypothetical protein